MPILFIKTAGKKEKRKRIQYLSFWKVRYNIQFFQLFVGVFFPAIIQNKGPTWEIFIYIFFSAHPIDIFTSWLGRAGVHAECSAVLNGSRREEEVGFKFNDAETKGSKG